MPPGLVPPLYLSSGPAISGPADASNDAVAGSVTLGNVYHGLPPWLVAGAILVTAAIVYKVVK